MLCRTKDNIESENQSDKGSKLKVSRNRIIAFAGIVIICTVYLVAFNPADYLDGFSDIYIGC